MTIEEKICSIAVPKHEILYDLESVVRLKDAIAIIKEACDKQRDICATYADFEVKYPPLAEDIKKTISKRVLNAPYPEFEEE